MLEQAGATRATDLEHLVEVVFEVRVWHVVDLRARVERTQQVDLLAGFGILRELQQMRVILPIHRDDVVEAIKVVRDELARLRGQLDALAARGLRRAGVRALTHVIGACARARDLEAPCEPGLFDQVLHHAFGGG